METLHYLLMRAHSLLNRRILDEAAGLGLSPGQPKVLEYLLILVCYSYLHYNLLLICYCSGVSGTGASRSPSRSSCQHPGTGCNCLPVWLTAAH